VKLIDALLLSIGFVAWLLNIVAAILLRSYVLRIDLGVPFFTELYVRWAIMIAIGFLVLVFVIMILKQWRESAMVLLATDLLLAVWCVSALISYMLARLGV
jgi:hypothetical protein